MSANIEIPVITESELSKVDQNLMNAEQLSVIIGKTPKKFIQTRPAKGGGVWEFVSAGYMKKQLNILFGWDWDFEIIDEIINPKQVIVKGKLTCRIKGKSIVKMQYGRKDVMYKKGTDTPLDLGNDLKAAASDSLKKCASEIGIASDVYNKKEFKEVQVVKDDLDEIVE